VVIREMTVANPDIEIRDRLAIADLLTEFGWRVDHGKADTVADLFVEDGSVSTPKFELQGRDAIDKHFSARARDDDRVTRHVWTNLKLTALDGHRIKAETAMQTYVCHGNTPDAARELVVGDSIDIVEKDADGRWRFVERRLVVALHNQGTG
jgi:uncharacterized protein (TIGR02246 family)